MPKLCAPLPAHPSGVGENTGRISAPLPCLQTHADDRDADGVVHLPVEGEEYKAFLQIVLRLTNANICKWRFSQRGGAQ